MDSLPKVFTREIGGIQKREGVTPCRVGETLPVSRTIVILSVLDFIYIPTNGAGIGLLKVSTQMPSCQFAPLTHQSGHDQRDGYAPRIAHPNYCQLRKVSTEPFPPKLTDEPACPGTQVEPAVSSLALKPSNIVVAT